jgi:hypothetical protein
MIYVNSKNKNPSNRKDPQVFNYNENKRPKEDDNRGARILVSDRFESMNESRKNSMSSTGIRESKLSPPIQNQQFKSNLDQDDDDEDDTVWTEVNITNIKGTKNFSSMDDDHSILSSNIDDSTSTSVIKRINVGRGRSINTN